jgi:hypothetical protein
MLNDARGHPFDAPHKRSSLLLATHHCLYMVAFLALAVMIAVLSFNLLVSRSFFT